MENLQVNLNDCIDSLSKAIIEKFELDKVVLIGIKTGGEFLAKRIRKQIHKQTGYQPDLGLIRISFYTDNLDLLYEEPHVDEVIIDVPVTDKVIIICDDVICTGKTMKKAIQVIQEKGQTNQIYTLALINKLHEDNLRKVDFVIKEIDTVFNTIIKVQFKEYHGNDQVLIKVK